MGVVSLYLETVYLELFKIKMAIINKRKPGLPTGYLRCVKLMWIFLLPLICFVEMFACSSYTRISTLSKDTVFVTVPCGYRSQRESFTNFFKCRELLSWLDSFPTYQPRSSNWSLQLRVRLIKIRICIRKESGICDINLQPIWPTVFLVCKNPQFMNCFEAKPSDSRMYSHPFEFEILNNEKNIE